MKKCLACGTKVILIAGFGVTALLAILWFAEGIAFESLLSALLTIVLTPYLAMIVEPFLARSLPPPKQSKPLGTATVIISAYLPNEQGLIVDSLLHIIQTLKFSGDLEVLLVYNTPYDLPIERRLRELEALHPSLRLVKTAGRSSKAQDLSNAIPLARGEIVALYDADSRPEPDALEQATHWLAAGFDFVQGANVIRNKSASFLSRLVAVEFCEKFFVTYSARFASAQVGYFCGSNGYWRKETLKQFLFEKEAYVEDIDCALRSTLGGARLCYDPSILASELAPVAWKAWWRQRARWAIGWMQLMVSHQWAVLMSSLSLKEKMYWSFFLLWRRLAIPVVLLAFPPALVMAVRKTSLVLSPITLLGFLGIIWLAALVQGATISARWTKDNIGTFSDILLYSFLFPLYDVIRLWTTVWAIFSRRSEWSVTPRS